MNRREAIQCGVSAAVLAAMRPALSRMGRGGVGLPNRNMPVGVVFSAGGSASLSFESLAIFKNRVRESRGFDTTPGPSLTPVTLSAAGWPTQDFSCLLWEGSVIPSWATAATAATPFKCGFIGSGSEAVTVVGGCTIANVVPGTGGAYTTFDLYNVTGTFGFNVTGTSGTVTNVFAYLPAYPASSIDDPTQASAYTNEAIAHFSQFSHVNWESFQNSANNSQVCTAASMRTPSNTQAHQRWNVPSPMVLTALPQAGDTSATFTANWQLPTGSYGIPLASAGNTCGRVCICTNGSPNFSWTQPLTEAVNTTGMGHTQPGMEGFPPAWAIALCKAARTGLWIHAPLLEDGTHFAVGTYMSAVFDLLNASWDFTIPVYIETSLEMWNYWFSLLNGIAVTEGFTNVTTYMAYRLHAMSVLGQSKLGSKWGNQVKQVFAWQTGATALFSNVLADIQSTYSVAPSADVHYLAIAPYCTPVVGNTDSAATIQGYITNGQGTVGCDGPRQALRAQSENIAIVGLSYGIPMVTYEDGVPWDIVQAVNPSAANVGAAIMDPGMTAALEVYQQGIFNSPYVKTTHTADGVSVSNNAFAPADELTNDYAALASSPTLLALLSFTNGATVTRNVVSGPGSVLDCINYADNDSVISASYPSYGSLNPNTTAPHILVRGYIAQTIWSPIAQTRTLVLGVTSTAAGATDIEVNGTVLYSNVTIPNFSGNGSVTIGSVSLKAGWNYICHGRSGVTQASVTPKSLTFN